MLDPARKRQSSRSVGMTVEQHLARAVQAQQKGQRADVIREAEAALRLRADHPIAHNILGMEALGRGDFPTAERHFNAAAKADPGAAALWLNLARARRLQGNDDGEREALESALETDQRNLNALIRLAELHERRGEIAEATTRWAGVAAMAQEHAGAGPDLQAYFNRARSFVSDRAQHLADALSNGLKADLGRRQHAIGGGLRRRCR